MRIIPENPHSKEPYWDNAARDILKTILFHIIDCGKPNNKKLMDFLRTQYTPLSLYNVLKNTAVKYAINIAFHLQTQETAKNVLSTLYSQANSILRREFYYSDSGFSARKWIREIDQNRGCCLYLVVTAAESNSYQTLFRLMIELMVREILSLDENAKRRIWLVLDEFQTLGKLAQMEEGLAQWRSFGGSAIVGTQSLAKVEEIYGKQTLRSFYQNLSTRLVFQYDESDGAKFITDNFGEGEISENQHNRMITRSGDRDISQVQEKISVKKALLPGELSLLKPLECYLKISEYPLTKISFIYKNPQRKHNLEAWELPYFEPLGAVDDDSNDRQKTLDFEKEEISDEPRERSDNENGGTKEAAAIEAQRDI
jgi:type IV secretory pathway TraG/TraD family ATPase VirD4